jgi:hypothetical protein
MNMKEIRLRGVPFQLTITIFQTDDFSLIILIEDCIFIII